MPRHALLIGLFALVAACGQRSLPSGGDPPDGGSTLDSATDGAPPLDAARPDSLPPPGQVTITTDKQSYGLGASAVGTVYNGSSGSIFLPGCGIFGREHQEGGVWVDRGPAMICGWEGNAVELQPGGTHSQTVSFEQPGSWRLTLDYGTGCLQGLPLSQAKCKAFGRAVSPQVDVVVDLASCQQLNKQYGKQLTAARACNSALSKPQCTALVAGNLSCGCSLYVNSTTQLTKLAQRWSDYDCSKLMPPCGIKCAAPQPASCIQDTCQPLTK